VPPSSSFSSSSAAAVCGARSGRGFCILGSDGAVDRAALITSKSEADGRGGCGGLRAPRWMGDTCRAVSRGQRRRGLQRWMG
jgi:hypothetical protein